MAEEPDPAGSISAASAGGEGEAERDAASPAAEEEEEREDHDAAVSEPDSEADSLRAREDAEAAEWLGTPTKKEELWAAEKKEREAKYAQMEDDIRKQARRDAIESLNTAQAVSRPAAQLGKSLWNTAYRAPPLVCLQIFRHRPG